MTIREACELWVSRDMNAIPQSVLVKLKQLDPDDIAELTPHHQGRPRLCLFRRERWAR